MIYCTGSALLLKYHIHCAAGLNSVSLHLALAHLYWLPHLCAAMIYTATDGLSMKRERQRESGRGERLTETDEGISQVLKNISVTSKLKEETGAISFSHAHQLANIT